MHYPRADCIRISARCGRWVCSRLRSRAGERAASTAGLTKPVVHILAIRPALLALLVLWLAGCSDDGPMPSAMDACQPSPPVDELPDSIAVCSGGHFLGSRFVCSLSEGGAVTCVGEGPVVSELPEFVGPVSALACGERHSCAIAGDGQVVCWGTNACGATSVPQFEVGERAVQVAVGGFHSCALTDGGMIRCWGAGRNVPPNLFATCNGIDSGQIPESAARWSMISAGDLSTCAVSPDRLELECWGHHMLSDSGTWRSPGSRIEQVALSGIYVCALLADGDVWCWSQLIVSGEYKFAESVARLGVGAARICLVRDDGTIVCVARGRARLCEQLAGIDVGSSGGRVCGILPAGGVGCAY